jgi:hypothetical protein
MSGNYLDFSKVRIAVKKDTDADLWQFGSDVITRMKNNVHYDPEKDQVGLVETTHLAYQAAVSAAADGGRSLILARKEKRTTFLQEKSRLVMMMELHTTEDATFFTDAGFRLRKTPARHLGPLPKPVIKYLRQGILFGSIDCESVDFPDSVKQIVARYSCDHGGPGTMGVTPAVKKLPFRTSNPARSTWCNCVTTTRQRMSDWSEPVAIFVL